MNAQSFRTPWILWLHYCRNLLFFSQYHKIHYCHIQEPSILSCLFCLTCIQLTAPFPLYAGTNWLECNTCFPCCSTAPGGWRSKFFREPRVYSTDYTAKMLRQQELLLSHKRLGKQSFKASFFHSMHRLRDMPRCATLLALQLLKVHRAEHVKKQPKVTTKASHFIRNFQK